MHNEFQGVCYQSSSGSRFMKSCFDTLPYAVRNALANSPYNICAACFMERNSMKGNYGIVPREYGISHREVERSDADSIRIALSILHEMENRIRENNAKEDRLSSLSPAPLVERAGREKPY